MDAARSSMAVDERFAPELLLGVCPPHSRLVSLPMCGLARFAPKHIDGVAMRLVDSLAFLPPLAEFAAAYAALGPAGLWVLLHPPPSLGGKGRRCDAALFTVHVWPGLLDRRIGR